MNKSITIILLGITLTGCGSAVKVATNPYETTSRVISTTVNTSGRVVTAGFEAAAPYQGEIPIYQNRKRHSNKNKRY